MVCCRQRCHPTGVLAEHKVGFWVGPCLVDWKRKQGPWERNRVVFERELLFAWFLWGIACLRVVAPLGGPL